MKSIKDAATSQNAKEIASWTQGSLFTLGKSLRCALNHSLLFGEEWNVVCIDARKGGRDTVKGAESVKTPVTLLPGMLAF
jgi:hypothetical protein